MEVYFLYFRCSAQALDPSHLGRAISETLVFNISVNSFLSSCSTARFLCISSLEVTQEQISFPSLYFMAEKCFLDSLRNDNGRD